MIFSTPILNRCVPNPVKDLSESILREFYGLLNSWGTLEQVLDDLYISWKQLLGLVFFALGTLTLCIVMYPFRFIRD